MAGAESDGMRLAGGEGAHNVSMARYLIDYGHVGFVQIDCGRIGGIRVLSREWLELGWRSLRGIEGI
jgi:L-alanine-DL-glutamate epimerase-like enolase superfamily enzyme